MKIFKKSFFVFAAVVLTALLITGCNKKGASATDAKMIGINIGYPENPFFQVVESSLREAFDKRGWTYLVTYGSDEKITENFTTLIAQGVDAMVDFACNGPIGTTAVRLAKDAGIPTISLEVFYEGGYFFGIDNERSGQVLGEEMVKWVTKYWDGKLDGIFISFGLRDGEEVLKRTKGAAEILEKKLGYGKDIEFWYDAGVGQMEGSRDALLDYLSGHPEYRHVAVISVSDSFMPPIIGGVETIGRQNDVCYGSHSENMWLFNHLMTTDETDPFIGTVAYFPSRYGEQVAKLLETLFSGGSIPEKTLAEPAVATRENVKSLVEEYQAALERTRN